ncbi:hypothetical protein [Phenylobacterium sp.]|jgi:hypothetical protein|uniref:hypothetical protein n=1 Tax=Phenylobacterium sp. TaxID=1871053 RepID=UPI002F40EE5E
MRPKLAFPGMVRVPGRAARSSVACLAFVLVLAAAFWAGVVWVAASLLTLFSGGY